MTDQATGDYLGKIWHGGIFLTSLANTLTNRAKIQEVMENPREEAVKWGHQSGQCSICGRRLDNAISVFNGIGPICAEKLGFPLATPPSEDSLPGIAASDLL